jgi:hypothetical protein
VLHGLPGRRARFVKPLPSDLLAFPVARISDNRVQGLLRELAETLEQEDDAESLRATARSLKMLADVARELAWTINKSRW